MGLNLLQVARRFGPVGGMERYVWELTRELAALGHKVTVLCEVLEAERAPEGVEVIELGEVAKKPRWLAHLRFSARVSQWVAEHPDADRIIHSHERTAVHQVTTFHGPPFARVLDRPWWKRCSLRVLANLWLERRELYGAQVRAVVPNSARTANALIYYYPELSPVLVEPVRPGTDDIPLRPERAVPEDGGVIGFVGKEWKRKGLDIAVTIVRELLNQRPNAQFVVIGPKPDEVRHLFAGIEANVTLLGETDSKPHYADFDLLLHPAREEPYGMVIAEARAAGVPVVISSACGIAEELPHFNVLNYQSGTLEWMYTCKSMLGTCPEPVQRGWRDVALEQVACYERLLPHDD